MLGFVPFTFNENNCLATLEGTFMRAASDAALIFLFNLIMPPPRDCGGQGKDKGNNRPQKIF